MVEQGIVEKIDDQLAFVKIYKNGSCDGCTLCESGGQPNERILEVKNSLSSSVGDWVKIDIPSSTVMKSAFMIFILPVLALITGYFWGQYFAKLFSISSEIINILAGLILAGFSFEMIKRFDRNMGKNQKNLPQMTDIIYHNHE